MPLVLLAPGLLDVDAHALATCVPLSHVAARAAGERIDDAESGLLHELGCDVAPAPLAALGAGLDVGGGWIARADPVTTLVGHDDVRIVARVDDLGDDEVRALRTLLDRHFADDGLAFAAPRRDAWFVCAATPHDVSFAPLAAAVGRALRTRLPGGLEARNWRRWWTEVQMLLHDQPLAARARFPVNALWFSGGGTLPAHAPACGTVYASATRHGDVLRGLATLGGTPARPVADARCAMADAQAVAADPVDDATLAAFAATLLAPALAALDAGRTDRLVLIGEGRDGAARWALRRAGLLDRLRRRSAPFAIPPREDA